jgi:phosphatidylserine/phosphatidylglycerophosphate/cardiolipin synthase-like enzyme
MRNLFNRNRTATLEFSSTPFDDRDFYYAFIKDLKHVNSMVVIESPYLTVKRALFFTDIFTQLSKHGVSVRINTREPSHHDHILEDQAWRAIKILKVSGARVFLCSDMRHRKLAILDGRTLWEGSLNILSQSDSTEIMRRTVSKDMCEQMAKFTKISTIQR